MFRSFLLAATIASLCACASTPPAAGTAQPPTGVCNAEGARWAIGSAVNDDVVNRILHDTGSRDARVLRPGQPATMDFREDRVNVDLNDRGAITGIRCG
ncbi:I78 family peptidase inhibitor [Lysobacter sp. LF1]|uniref:I78 family peptidase inhibitor n=1 Tax=Lysobacter stagni TaxID=3045172 RepID=A0ABT6XDC9_9GAMM|nr:I78 family peptidase inhibitor [Lysobacter sp. LF1]MDI9238142.1 I78 family peptidase inhibitor [Lysobacter sp. LF1]